MEKFELKIRLKSIATFSVSLAVYTEFFDPRKVISSVDILMFGMVVALVLGWWYYWDNR